MSKADSLKGTGQFCAERIFLDSYGLTDYWTYSEYIGTLPVHRVCECREEVVLSRPNHLICIHARFILPRSDSPSLALSDPSSHCSLLRIITRASFRDEPGVVICFLAIWEKAPKAAVAAIPLPFNIFIFTFFFLTNTYMTLSYFRNRDN